MPADVRAKALVAGRQESPFKLCLARQHLQILSACVSGDWSLLCEAQSVAEITSPPNALRRTCRTYYGQPAMRRV